MSLNQQTKSAQEKKDQSAVATGPVPPVLVAIRDKLSVTFVEGPFDSTFTGNRLPIETIQNPSSDVVFTRDGSKCAVATNTDIKVFSCGFEAKDSSYASSALTLISSIPHGTARSVELSPLGNFVTTFETYSKAMPENHIVWNVATKEPVLKFTQKLDLTVSTHPLIQWTCDEKYLCILAPGELLVYDGQQPSEPIARVHHAKLNAFALSRPVAPVARENNRNGHRNNNANNNKGVSAGPLVSLFSPVHGNHPAKLSIYKLNEVVAGKTLLPPPPPPSPADIACGRVKPGQHNNAPREVPLQPTSTMTFFKASEASMNWNDSASALLCGTSFEDNSGESYYGESRLYLVRTDNNFQCTVSFGASKGPVHDVAWVPNAEEFVTLQGEAKNAKATVWSAKDCNPLKEFGSGPWNLIRFNPSGRFVALAGFGSLAGRVEVWDHRALVRICSFQDADSPRTLEWTPCGRYFATATIFPWLRVGNQFKMYRYDGTSVYAEKPGMKVSVDPEYPHFHQVAVRPALTGVYPDLPAEASVMDKAVKAMKSPQAVQAQATKSYVPPHLRNQQATAPKVNQMKAVVTGPKDYTKEKNKSALTDVGGAMAVEKAVAHNTASMTNMSIKSKDAPSWRAQ